MLKQHVIVEFNHFLTTITKNRSNVKTLTTPSLIRMSLHLLEDLPAARDVLLEYFGLVADVAVQSYVDVEQKPGAVQRSQGGGNSSNSSSTTSTSSASGNAGGSGSNNALSSSEDEQQHCFDPIEESLINVMRNNPIAWSPIVASWSLELIGTLSQNFGRHNLPLTVACNYWMKCSAMRSLLNLICLSFSRLKTEEAEFCVDTLFGAYRRNTSLNWVVARIGGSFPTKIISRLLQCCLKRYSEDFHCRLEAEIDILEYLCLAHEQYLRQVFKDLMQDGFKPKRSLDALIVPFMLVIANISDVLLQNMANVFVEIYNDELLTNIIQKYPLWKNNSTFMVNQPALKNVVLRLKRYGVHLLLISTHLANQYSWCQDFLECSLQELEHVILNCHTCPLVNDLMSDNILNMLWERCLSQDLYEQQTAVRLLLIASCHRSYIYHQSISELLRKDYSCNNNNGLDSLIRILMGFSGIVAFPDIKAGIQMVLEDILLQEQFPSTCLLNNRDHSQSFHVMRNLFTITKMQKMNSIPSIRPNQLANALIDCLPKLLQLYEVILSRLMLQIDCKSIKQQQKWELNNDRMMVSKRLCLMMKKDRSHHHQRIDSSPLEEDDDDYSSSSSHLEIDEKSIALAHIISDLLNIIEAGGKTNILGTNEILKISVLSVKYFFITISLQDSKERYAAVNRVFLLLKRICRARKATRTTCLRELIQGALFYHRYLFEQFEEPELDELSIPNTEMVLLQNLRQNLGPNSNRTSLHAGVIGRGLRSELPANFHCSPKANESQILFIKALAVCCSDVDYQVSVEASSTVALLLVEFVSPDIMYNGLPFPEEEFTKVTMERDLLIRRAFVSTPLLWMILGYVATHRPALCFLSVLLRALCATCLHQWRAKNVNKYQTADPNEELMQCTKKLLQILTMGQLLPPPLSTLHVIIEHFEPPEIALLLKECIWNYLKDHVPSPALFHVDSNGLQWRNPHLNKVPAQYVDTLRNLMQKKLAKLGQHYYEMFIMPEQLQQLQQQQQQQQQQQKQSLSVPPTVMMTASGIPMGVASCIPSHTNRSAYPNSGVFVMDSNSGGGVNPMETLPARRGSVLILDEDVTMTSTS